ncbi:MAG: isoaspartyl peptidase/L-asparaginase [Marinirhabdus sp.]|nr:isoaspartyl peptidase/L-asparaginase [Marinirhabdus sp.]
MNRILTLLIGFYVLFSCENVKESPTKMSISTSSSDKIDEMQPTFGIVIHGGAGTILKKNMSDSMELAYKQKLEEAIRVGHDILKNGGTAMEAVTKTINVMEDSPLFNAGKGAVFTHDETNELDASVMDGATLNAGAVAGVSRIKNPIDLAVAVMDHSDHVMLSGRGAEIFAESQGIALIDPSYFYTERRFNALKRIKQEEDNRSAVTEKNYQDPFIQNSKYGTVGCAALDQNGNLAAGTSTGGMTNKRWNRIGDAPIIGAGTYANNATCAVSSTGWGEYFIRGMVAHDISAMMEYKGISLKEATHEVIQNKLTDLGGTGGVVAIDKNGEVSMDFNTEGMYRAHMNAKGELSIGIYQNEEE